jgi:hypothetical protein
VGSTVDRSRTEALHWLDKSQANVGRSYFFCTEYFLLDREMFLDQGWTKCLQIGTHEVLVMVQSLPVASFSHTQSR